MASKKRKALKSLMTNKPPPKKPKSVTKKWDSSMSQMPNMTKALEKLRGKPFKSQKELDDYLVKTNKGRTSLSERVKNITKKPFTKKPGAVLTPFAKGLAGTIGAGEAGIAGEVIRRKIENKNKKHGGKITSRMTGGQVVSHGYD